jgi:hypothetical protein
MTQAFAINFELLKVEDIMPWGTGTDRKLHWFGLTDGFYWVSTPLGEALRYTEAALAEFNRKSPYCDSPYLTYQVAQIFQDIQQVLPYALEPVPADIAEIVTNPDWIAKGDAWFESDQSSSELREEWWEAIEWWNYRSLDTAYMVHGPTFQFWRVEDQISIRSDSNEAVESIWKLPRGEFSLDVQSFTSSCESFLQRVIDQMQTRVDCINQQGWLRKDCVLDIPLLNREQRDRAALIKTIKDRRPNTDWNVARERLHKLRQHFE